MWPYIITYLDVRDVRDVGHDYDWYDLLDLHGSIIGSLSSDKFRIISALD